MVHPSGAPSLPQDLRRQLRRVSRSETYLTIMNTRRGTKDSVTSVGNGGTPTAPPSSAHDGRGGCWTSAMEWTMAAQSLSDWCRSSPRNETRMVKADSMRRVVPTSASGRWGSMVVVLSDPRRSITSTSHRVASNLNPSQSLGSLVTSIGVLSHVTNAQRSRRSPLWISSAPRPCPAPPKLFIVKTLPI